MGLIHSFPGGGFFTAPSLLFYSPWLPQRLELLLRLHAYKMATRAIEKTILLVRFKNRYPHDIFTVSNPSYGYMSYKGESREESKLLGRRDRYPRVTREETRRYVTITTEGAAVSLHPPVSPTTPWSL